MTSSSPVLHWSVGSREISCSDYEYLCNKTDKIIRLTDSEQLFAVVVECFADFERLVFEEAFSEMLGAPTSSLKGLRVDSHRLFMKVNAKLLSFLSAAKAFEEQLPFFVGVVAGNGAESEFSARIDRLEKELDSVKLARGIRNLAQHCRLPVETSSFGTARDFPTSLKSSFRFRHSLGLFLDATKLLSMANGEALGVAKPHTGTRKRINDVCSRHGARLDLSFLVRRYMSALGALHLAARVETEAELEKIRNDLCRMCQRVIGDENRDGQAWIEKASDPRSGRAVDSSIFAPIDQRRCAFKGIDKVHQRYVGLDFRADDRAVYLDGDDVWMESARNIWQG